MVSRAGRLGLLRRLSRVGGCRGVRGRRGPVLGCVGVGARWCLLVLERAEALLDGVDAACEAVDLA